ncbi:MAG TPA: hypothetical protein VEJ18_17500 [Planctomycetota bacterium]|nr:hypothetical protein [Planctomycetota bacterium]
MILFACVLFLQEPAPPAMENRIRVRVVEYVDEARTPSETRQAWPALIQAQGTELWYDHERHYYGRPAATVPAPLPLQIGWITAVRDHIIGVPFVEETSVLTIIGDTRTDPDPTVTRSLLSHPGSGGDLDDSDSGPMSGPELTVPLARDLSEWRPTGWLPSGTELQLYGRMLLGDVEVFGVDSDLRIYSAGPRLLVPLAAASWVKVGATASVGPAWLDTDIGEALGLEMSAGLRAELPLVGSVSFVALGEVGLFATEDFRSLGPGLNVGLMVPW